MNDVSEAQALIGRLSPLEVEFLRGLTAGCSQAVIASQLNLTGSEATGLKQSLMKKLGAAVTADAARIGIYAGL